CIRRRDAELIALSRHARRRFPARERVGKFHFDDGFAVFVGDDIGLPEDCRTEIAANLHGWLLSGRLDICGLLGSRLRIEAPNAPEVFKASAIQWTIGIKDYICP